MDRLEIFKTELDYIRDAKIREFTEKVFKLVPDYFFTVAASSTGKYHPSYALGNGGLTRHTKAAVRIAIELFRLGNINYDDYKKDIIISALILHDTLKQGDGNSNHTVADHPLQAVNFIKKNIKGEDYFKSQSSYESLLKCIASHMGCWNKDYKTKKEILPIPEKGIQWFVHLCDYIASRKCLEFNFDVDVKRD